MFIEIGRLAHVRGSPLTHRNAIELPSGRRHHRRKCLRTQEEAIRIARQFCEVPSLIERLGRIIDAVEDDCYERERLTRLIAIAQSLRQKQITQLLTLIEHAHSQPCQDCHRQGTSRQFAGELRRQVTKVNLARRERVEAGDRGVGIEKDSCGGESLVLMLQRFGVQPVIDRALAAIKWTALVTSMKLFERESLR